MFRFHFAFRGSAIDNLKLTYKLVSTMPTITAFSCPFLAKPYHFTYVLAWTEEK